MRADIGGAPAPWDDYWYNPLGSSSASGMRVTSESAKRLSTVIAAVSAKGRSLAILPCKIYTDTPGGGKRIVRNHPLYDLLYQRPNDLQTAYEFKQMMQAHVELRGNGYAEKIPGPRGAVDQLIPMHPDRVKVEVLQSGRLRYQYNDPLTNTTRTLVQDEVFHLRDWSDHTSVGQSRIAMGVDVLGVALAQQDYTARYMKNDASSGLIITGTDFKNKSDEELYIKKFEESSTGKNRHRIKILPPGIDIKQLGVKPIDMQLLDARKASAIEICTIFNILPHLIGVDTGKAATYASVEQFNIMHAQQTVLPMIIMWEQAIQRDLMTSENYYAKFSMASLLRGDFATRTAGYAVGLGSSGPGWMCPDDVRELEDLNPIADGSGKTFWRPVNMAPLNQINEPVQPGKDPAPDDDNEVEDGAGSGEGDDSKALRGQLHLMASSSAQRCVRREVSGVRKLIEQRAGAYEVTEFYVGQRRFIAEVFSLSALQALNIMDDCNGRAQHLSMLLDQEQYADAIAWIENIAAIEPSKLANLVVEGVK